jgi:hypothetical protein
MSQDDPDICTLPPVIHGWSFYAKKWGDLLVDDLSAIEFSDDAFENLVLPSEYKDLVLAFADVHEGKTRPLLKDLVMGKGGGIVMLLHGKPGWFLSIMSSQTLRCSLAGCYITRINQAQAR